MGYESWEIEDYLQEQGVFLNGLTGEPAHSDSYMTVISFKALEEAFNNSKFKKEVWEHCVEEWIYQGYLTPIKKLLGLTIKRWLNS